MTKSKTEHLSASEATLDMANEQSFPASDPVASSNITRIEKKPEKVNAAVDHQNHHKVKTK